MICFKFEQVYRVKQIRKLIIYNISYITIMLNDDIYKYIQSGKTLMYTI